MPKRRLCRWLQFGILDLLILTTIVAAVISLLSPARAKAHQAPPWIVGEWLGDGVAMQLYPDGYYGVRDEREWSYGFGWTIAPAREIQNAFALKCGKVRFVLRSEWGSGVMELLNQDGSVQVRLTQSQPSHGPMCNGCPHGRWTWTSELRSQNLALEYRDGEIVDVHDAYGVRDWVVLNWMRKNRGLTPLPQRDFPE